MTEVRMFEADTVICPAVYIPEATGSGAHHRGLLVQA